jgi:hypothetical protein
LEWRPKLNRKVSLHVHGIPPRVFATQPSEVPEALRYLGEGLAKGKVVITVDQNDNT